MLWRRWVKPEVYPLMVPIIGVLGLVATQLIRNISTNPDVRVTKENRTAGILENHKEGEKYAEHGLRKFVRGRTPQIMPSINDYFTREKQS
ncbi:NADH-ubiquinone reductase complex 1 MLRQ subunit [Artemisia annua]|uniref:NADH-ubiquinone reductase complex 1 MLRQ subunit n=1 Tax=Artemisia annua TaxID=35608 RepID=A0A2U1KPT6_ARTAN|nr:NADH-ubiquinone reductase complex 1 MLRQ subunit [Artemisia annua]